MKIEKRRHHGSGRAKARQHDGDLNLKENQGKQELTTRKPRKKHVFNVTSLTTRLSLRRHQTLNEKSINAVIMSCYDESSNNSTGSVKSSSSTQSISYFTTQTIKKDDFASPQKSLSINSTIIENTPNVPNYKTKSTADVVLVPSWRVISFRPHYRIEGTENLIDETFIKRHQKCENEEIKIQRWDMKRQRDEQERNRLLLKATRQNLLNTPIGSFKSAQSSPMPVTNLGTPQNKITLKSANPIDDSFRLNENVNYDIEIVRDEEVHCDKPQIETIKQPDNRRLSNLNTPTMRSKVLSTRNQMDIYEDLDSDFSAENGNISRNLSQSLDSCKINTNHKRRRIDMNN